MAQTVMVLPNATNTLEAEFARHEKKWKKDTRFVSSLHDKYLHPSYARIIGLGVPVVPYILRGLERESDDWFYALRSVTGENPVPMSAAGNVPKMADIWLTWGRKRGLL